MALNTSGLDHPAVAVSDVDGVAQWYCDVLGFEKEFRNDKPVWILRAPDDTLLEVVPVDDTPRPKRTTWTPGWSHLALRVDDIEEAISFLDSKDVTWMGKVTDAIGGGQVRSFSDPEGNMLQIVER